MHSWNHKYVSSSAGFSDDCLSLRHTRTSCDSHPLQDVTNYLDLSSAEPFTDEPHLWGPVIAGTLVRRDVCVSVRVTFTGFTVSIVWGYMQLLRECASYIPQKQNNTCVYSDGIQRVPTDSHLHIPWYLLGIPNVTFFLTLNPFKEVVFFLFFLIKLFLLIIYSPPCHPRCPCLFFFSQKEMKVFDENIPGFFSI